MNDGRVLADESAAIIQVLESIYINNETNIRNMQWILLAFSILILTYFIFQKSCVLSPTSAWSYSSGVGFASPSTRVHLIDRLRVISGWRIPFA